MGVFAKSQQNIIRLIRTYCTNHIFRTEREFVTSKIGGNPEFSIFFSLENKKKAFPNGIYHSFHQSLPDNVFYLLHNFPPLFTSPNCCPFWSFLLFTPLNSTSLHLPSSPFIQPYLTLQWKFPFSFQMQQ